MASIIIDGQAHQCTNKIVDLVHGLRDDIADLKAHLTRAIDFAKKAGHLLGCGAPLCALCGMSEYWHDKHGEDEGHDFQPGPCGCGHDELVGV